MRDLPTSETMDDPPTPSERLTARSLSTESNLTTEQLAERTGLPTRTVRDALDRLRNRGVVETRRKLLDARKTVHSLTSDE